MIALISGKVFMWLVTLLWLLGIVSGAKYIVITTDCTTGRYPANFGADNMENICKGPNGGGSRFWKPLHDHYLDDLEQEFGTEEHEFVTVLDEPIQTVSLQNLFASNGISASKILDINGKDCASSYVWTHMQYFTIEGKLLVYNCNNWSTLESTVAGGVGRRDVSSWWKYTLLSCAYPQGAYLYCYNLAARVFGDPHFVGFNGCRYDFTGIDGEVYAIYADVDLQVNALIQSLTVKGTDGTWMTKIGVISPDAAFVFDPNNGVLDMYTNTLFNSWSEISLNSTTIKMEFNENKYIEKLVVKADHAQIVVKVKRFGSLAKEYYLDIDMVLFSLPVDPHGVLGQTAVDLTIGSSTVTECSKSVEGEEDDYLVQDGLAGTNFVFQRFGGVTEGVQHKRTVLPSPITANTLWHPTSSSTAST